MYITRGNFILLIIMLNFKLEQVSVLCPKCMTGWPVGQEKQHIQGGSDPSNNFTKFVKKLKISNK